MTNVEYYGKRLKFTSIALIGTGAIGAAVCILKGFNARHIAERIMNPHGGQQNSNAFN